MVVPEDWQLVGGDPAPGDPTAYAQLAEQLGRTAVAAGDAHGQLRTIQDQVDDAIWRGKSADAFRDRIEKLPDKLKKLHASYDKASTALRDYGAKLEGFKREADSIVDEARRAQQEETGEQARLDQARAQDPNVPTTAEADAVEAARQRLRTARDQIDRIREERKRSESQVIASLDDAGDAGIHNKSVWAKGFRALADAAEFVAFTLAVVAIALVVVVFLTTPGGWAALGAGLAAAGPLFSAATAFSGTSLVSKGFAKAFGDDDITLGALAKDGVILIGSWGFGKMLQGFKPTQFRSMTMEFRHVTTELRPLLRVVTATDDFLLVQVRTTMQVTRVDMVRTVMKPLRLDTVWDMTFAWYHGIPTYLNQHPEVAQAVGQRPPPGVVMASTGKPGGPPTVLLTHTPITEPAGAR